MNSMRRWTSLLLLVIWTGIQMADLYHHAHEEAEVHCEVDGDHFCETHLELELCGLCTVVHGNADIKSEFSVPVVYREQTDVYAIHTENTATESKRSLFLRGPPIG
jgi:hypothetical protein